MSLLPTVYSAQEAQAPANGYASLDARLEVPKAEVYADIWKRSPFTFTTITQPPAIAPANWADSYDLAGYTKLDGKEYVALFNRVTQKEMTVTRTPNKSGVVLVAYEYNPDRKFCKAIVRKNNELGEIKFRPPALSPGPTAKPPETADKGTPPNAGAQPPPGTNSGGQRNTGAPFPPPEGTQPKPGVGPGTIPNLPPGKRPQQSMQGTP
ncbi:MAG: hypothetical protein ACAI35_03450 [Candidatus Methylacidiphilales bacterium]|nr:hypothetical protein [Candidatus Methylacidiphilales bacterium]